jgi:MFS family permease
MPEPEVKIYPYRWIVLGAFLLINVMMQVLWICYAPVATLAADGYQVNRESIDMLANLFLLVYLPVAIPAAWAIDTFGFKKAVGLGAVLMALFGALRALFPTSYTAALIGSIGIAIGQPFLLNAFTKMAALWFPQKQRATITGVIFLGLFFGIGLGEALGPGLVSAYGLSGMQTIYAIAAIAAALLFLLFARSNPPTPASPPDERVRALVLDSFKQILRNRNVYVLALALLIASGIVNGVFTVIDGLAKELSLSSGDGVLLTSLLLLGGIVGSVVVPAVSDTIKRRKPILVAAVFLGVPATLGLVLGRGLPVEIVCFFLMGVCITGVVPVAYQYGAEITHPAPEGTSNGILALVVQAAGLLIVLMDALRGVFNNSYIPSFIGLAVLLAVSGIIMLSLEESPEMAKVVSGTDEEAISTAPR